MRHLVEFGSPKFLVELEKQNLRLLSRLMEEKHVAVCLEMLLMRPKSYSVESLRFVTIDCGHKGTGQDQVHCCNCASPCQLQEEHYTR